MNECPHLPNQHSYVKDDYLYCEVCKIVCNHHADMKGSRSEVHLKNMKKRTIFCRDGHDVKEKDLIFDRDNKPICKIHPDKTWRWKVKYNRPGR